MKIRKIEFQSHPVLGDLKLDFTDRDGKVVNTIILAGENGSGKSLILNILFNFSNLSPDNARRNEKRYFEIEISDLDLETLKKNQSFKNQFQEPFKNNVFKINIDYSLSDWDQIKISSEKLNGKTEIFFGALFSQSETRKILKTIFSDVEINFTPNEIQTVTSKNIDSEKIESERSSSNLATEITQLLIDLQSIDALEFTEWARTNYGQPVDETKIDVRTKRFTTAFDFMFPSKKFKRIETSDNRKGIIFEENGKEMNITKLSSGEKQIVFRGSFLLKDKNSSKGALVLIDEPEISLHPLWQLKILTFFKKLFTFGSELTSQLIVATHSPFIIHNATRNEDKVIVLQKNATGTISLVEEPQFFSWSASKKVRDAFKIAQLLKPNLITVFVEGETDELYFKKTLEVFGIDLSVIDFKWIGRYNDNGNVENSGDSALNQARTFFLANKDMLIGKVVLLYDNDTNKNEETFEDLEIRRMKTYKENTIYEIGIENLLILPTGFNKSVYYKERVKKDKYGAESIIRELDKSKLCNFLCSTLSREDQRLLLINLKTEIDNLIK